MCRYAMSNYKEHFACFECRKTFKRRRLWDIDREKVLKQEEELPAKCPECGQLMADMGKDFEAPKKKDLKTWNHIQSLYEVGITFHSCGCIGPGYIPRDKASLLQLLNKNRTTYLSNLNLGLERLRIAKEPKAIRKLSEAVDSWKGKLEVLDQHIVAIQ